MSNTPIVYSSSDASAPQVTGQVGSLVALLDAVLVTGYGAKAGCGWTKPSGSTGTLAAYRNSPTTGTGMYVQVKDNAEGTGGAKEAQLRGFESMTDASTGTGQFPSNAQLSTGVIWHKSSAASSTTRPWWAIGCERWMYLFVDSAGIGLDGAGAYFVGDLSSFRPGDASHFAVIGSEASNQAASNIRTRLGTGDQTSSAPSATVYLGWIARNYGQVPGGIRITGSETSMRGSGWGAGGVDSYPFAVNNGLVFERGLVHEAASRPRGRLPGLYVPLHAGGSFLDLQQLTSVPGLPGSTNLIVKLFRTGRVDGGGTQCALLFDITNAD